MQNNYLKSVVKQLNYYKSIGTKSFEQLNDSSICWQFNEESNSIAILVKHVVGNQFSRFTNFLTEDGEKDWRNRDSEFENEYASKEEMTTAWNNGWDCLFNAFEELTENDLQHIVYIRNQGHTVTEAINRQLCHYSYHVGQIVYVAKMIKNHKWNSLSIPKNSSKNYNKDKFSKEKSLTHFTDNL